MLRIFIPTRGRYQKLVTEKKYRLDEAPYTVTYVVPFSERKHWKGFDPLCVPDEYKLSDVRQFILRQDGRYHVVLDDDLDFCARLNGKLIKAGGMKSDVHLSSVCSMFSWILRKLKIGYLHGGISNRLNNNRVKLPTTTNTRCGGVHFYNRPKVLSTGFDFREVVLKQDMYFTLSMLLRGYENIVSFNWAFDQVSGSGGGCSVYRDQELLDSEAERLKELFPDFVTIVEKQTKGTFSGVKRKEVRVAWKKAYEYGMSKRKAPNRS